MSKGLRVKVDCFATVFWVATVVRGGDEPSIETMHEEDSIAKLVARVEEYISSKRLPALKEWDGEIEGLVTKARYCSWLVEFRSIVKVDAMGSSDVAEQNGSKKEIEILLEFQEYNLEEITGYFKYQISPDGKVWARCPNCEGHSHEVNRYTNSFVCRDCNAKINVTLLPSAPRAEQEPVPLVIEVNPAEDMDDNSLSSRKWGLSSRGDADLTCVYSYNGETRSLTFNLSDLTDNRYETEIDGEKVTLQFNGLEQIEDWMLGKEWEFNVDKDTYPQMYGRLASTMGKWTTSKLELMRVEGSIEAQKFVVIGIKFGILAERKRAEKGE